MPKRLKKKAPKRRLPTDVNQQAAALVALTTQEREPQDFKEQLSAYMARLGSKGGKISGAKRMEMDPKKRSAIALKAALTRWNKRKA